MQYIVLFFENFIDMFVDVAPYIILGLIFVGLLNAYVQKDLVLKHLGGEGFSSVVKASIVGVPLPLCSCGVVPTAIGLKKSGASNGAVTSFLISTPQTGVDSILATYSLMGLVMAIFRPIVAFISGIIGGLAVGIFAKNEKGDTNVEVHSCCCGGGEETKAEEHCCCCHEEEQVEEHCCCGGQKEEAKAGESKFFTAMKNSFGSFLDEMTAHFVIGMLISALITTFVPTDFFVNIGLDSGIFAMIAMVIIGIPMYICSVGAIPIAISLVAKGLSYGSAFVFLFAGPVTNVASILVLSKALGKKVTSIYIAVMIVCSIGFGLLLDFLIATFDLSILTTAGAVHHSGGIFSVILAVILGILMIKSVAKRGFASKK
ncbi:MAG: SO_0444 family Cu/Zn efflux transporter [Bacillota bacterium]